MVALSSACESAAEELSASNLGRSEEAWRRRSIILCCGEEDGVLLLSSLDGGDEVNCEGGMPSSACREDWDADSGCEDDTRPNGVGDSVDSAGDEVSGGGEEPAWKLSVFAIGSSAELGQGCLTSRKLSPVELRG